MKVKRVNKMMIFENLVLFLFVIILILLVILNIFSNNSLENYSWSCTFTPNKDYYKQDWILGDNHMSDRIASLAIKK